MSKLAVGTTAKIMMRGQAAMKQEADYELAAAAAPGGLKTVEALLMTDPEHEGLKQVLAESYCQYASAFIEDDWEIARFAKNFDKADEIAVRATKAYMRCIGYALEVLGPAWKKALHGSMDSFEGLVKKAGSDQRDGMMALAMGLGGAINLNKDNVELIGHFGKVKLLVDRVVALDQSGKGSKDPSRQALALLVVGKLNAGLPSALGGKPDIGRDAFLKAVQITGGKHLLAMVFLAQTYAVSTQNSKLFRDTLVKVLQTDPAIWPEERLMGEVAHRRARRYLTMEKEWF